MCLRLVKGVSPAHDGGVGGGCIIEYTSKSRVYKLMHVKSLEQNRPACIMERNAESARPAGVFQAWRRRPESARCLCQGPMVRARAQQREIDRYSEGEGERGSGKERGQRSTCDIINRYDAHGRGVNAQCRRNGRSKRGGEMRLAEGEEWRGGGGIAD